ncbi:MAG: hypothetical protein QW057_00285 [Candidatus Bathyarchaeia archaeon]
METYSCPLTYGPNLVDDVLDEPDQERAEALPAVLTVTYREPLSKRG